MKGKTPPKKRPARRAAPGGKPLEVGILSSGRDDDARLLLKSVVEGLEAKSLSARYLFVNRERRDRPESDRLLDEAEGLGLKTVALSSLKFKPDLKRSDEVVWNRAFHAEALKRLAPLRKPRPAVDLALGYIMVIRSPEFLRELDILNLHPSPLAADGRGAEVAGHWTHVMWEHLRQRSGFAGAMLHRMTLDLDKGPCATHCRVSLRGPEFDPLWRQFDDDRAHGLTVADLQKRFPDWRYPEGSYPLFTAIRKAQFAREVPLTLVTLERFARGELAFKGGALVDSRGRPREPEDVTEEVEARLRKATF
jgi:phosphoribosylglycinamide formyltransferase-1